MNCFSFFKRKEVKCNHKWIFLISEESKIFFNDVDKKKVEECLYCKSKRVTWENTLIKTVTTFIVKANKI